MTDTQKNAAVEAAHINTVTTPEQQQAFDARLAKHYASRAALPTTEQSPAREAVCWMIRSRETRIPFWGFVQNHYRSKEDAEKACRTLYNYEPFPLYATPQPAPVTGGASIAEEWCAYMDDAVSKAPEPLRKLGEYLSGVLDEDQWKTAERYLNAAALSPSAPEAPSEQSAARANDVWKKYADDFDALSDAEIEQESEQCRNQVDEAEDWLEAVASWEAAGKPRKIGGAS